MTRAARPRSRGSSPRRRTSSCAREAQLRRDNSAGGATARSRRPGKPALVRGLDCPALASSWRHSRTCRSGSCNGPAPGRADPPGALAEDERGEHRAASSSRAASFARHGSDALKARAADSSRNRLGLPWSTIAPGAKIAAASLQSLSSASSQPRITRPSHERIPVPSCPLGVYLTQLASPESHPTKASRRQATARRTPSSVRPADRPA